MKVPKNYFDKSKPSIEVIRDIIQSVRNQEVNYNRNSQNKLSPVDLEIIIRKYIEALDENLIKKDIKIEYPSNYYHVMADKSLLMNNVLANILSNSIKFSERGSTIAIDCNKLTNNKIEIIIRDYGTGLTKEQIEEFQDKSRIKTSKGTEGEKGTWLWPNAYKELHRAI